MTQYKHKYLKKPRNITHKKTSNEINFFTDSKNRADGNLGENWN